MRDDESSEIGTLKKGDPLEASRIIYLRNACFH